MTTVSSFQLIGVEFRLDADRDERETNNMDGMDGRTDLEGEGNGHADDEEEEGHDEVGEVAAIPRRVPDDRPLAAGSVHQYHQLHINDTEHCWQVTDNSAFRPFRGTQISNTNSQFMISKHLYLHRSIRGLQL